jgi:hypothetical protein
MGLVKMDENNHHLDSTSAQLTRPISLVACCQSVGFPLRFKPQPKTMDIAKQWQSNSWQDPSDD